MQTLNDQDFFISTQMELSAVKVQLKMKPGKPPHFCEISKVKPFLITMKQ